jgi:hypothetical protein
VDDIVTIAKNAAVADVLRAKLRSEFTMSQGSLLTWCLGMHFFVSQMAGTLSTSSNTYLANWKNFRNLSALAFNRHHFLPFFNQFSRKPTQTAQQSQIFLYRSLVGSLMYAAVGARPDLSAAVSIVSRYLAATKKAHCDLVRGICRYLRGNPRGLHYKANRNFTLEGFVDASYANDADYSSISGNAFFLVLRLLDVPEAALCSSVFG